MSSRPFVTTFYSYKGGVGRTTLAANVAVALARRGKTLLWDLDVEAPGLEHITALKTSQPIQRGYFSAMVEWQKAKCPAKLDKPLLQAWDAALYAVQAQPELFLLSAAPDARTQVSDYMALDWAAFFGREPQKGLDLFDALLAHWADAGFEFVVIDSRTGITDLGALLTALVPDVTVLVGNFGVQNVNGLRLAWQALQPATGEMDKRVERGLNPLVRELVASPIPNDSKRRAAGNEIWEERFGLRPSEWITIPEDPVLRFSEAIALLEFPQAHPLVAKYEDVAKRILAAREQQEEALREDASASALYPELMKPRGGLLRPGERGREAQERGRRFEDQVAHVLQLLRHTVERETLVDGNCIDLIATTSGTLEDVTWFVECKETSVTKDMVDKLAMWVQDDPQAKARNARAMIVGRSFALAVLQQARSRGVQCFTLSQLEERLFNFKPYLAQLRANFEQSRLSVCYVSQYVKRNRTSSDDASDKRDELLPLAVDWATGKGRPLWVLLGDYGTGKTAFTHRFAYELARRCETEPATPVPLLINLRDYPNATSLETVIDEHLAKSGQERGRAGAILHLVAQGRCVLLLDSFDEMGLAAVGVSVEEQFRQLARPTADVRMPAGGRVLVTCREEFFKERKEAEATVSGSGDQLARPGSALEQAAKAFDAQIDALPYFDHEQIREYLEKRLGEEKAGEALERIGSIHGLSDLATRPQLLEIVLESLPDLIAQGKAVSPGVLYYTYVNRWLNRHRPVGARLSVRQVIQLLELLAQTLWARGATPLHYLQLSEAVRGYQDIFPNIDPVHVDLELRTAAFLTRSPEGLYRFSHRSFLEFFYACRLLSSAQERESKKFIEALSGAPLRIEVVRFFADLWNGTGHKNPCALLADLLGCDQEPMAAANLFRMAWWLGKYAGENTATLSGIGERLSAEQAVWRQVMPAEPKQMMLARADLSDMDLRGAPLSRAILKQAILNRSDLSNSNLEDANIQGAQASDANFNNASCRNLRASEICALNTTWRNAKIEAADFTGALLRNSDWRNSIIIKSKFSEADMCFSLLNASHQPKLQGAIVNHASILAGETNKAGSFAYDEVCWRQASHITVNFALFSPNEALIVSGGNDGEVKIWDSVSGRGIKSFNADNNRVYCATFSQDGLLLACGGDSGVIKIWDMSDGSEIFHVTCPDEIIISIAVLPDKNLLVSCDEKNSVRLWDIKNNIELRAFKASEQQGGKILVSCDGSLVAAGGKNGTVRLWRVLDGQELQSFNCQGAPIESIALLPGKDWIATSSVDGTLRLWSMSSGEEIWRNDFVQGGNSILTFSHNGLWLIGGARGGVLYLWDAFTGKILNRFGKQDDWPQCAAFSSKKHQIIVGDWGGNITLWDANSGRELRRLESPWCWVFDAAFSADGQLFACADENAVRIYEAGEGQELLRFQPNNGIVRSVAFSPVENVLACGNDKGDVCLWGFADTQNFRYLIGESGGLECLVFSPDGKLLFSGDRNGRIQLWDVSSGQLVRCFTGHSDWVLCLAISSDGAMLASSSWDGSARTWNISSGEALRIFKIGDEKGLSAQCVAFSPDNHILACGDGNGFVWSWDLHTEQQLLCLKNPGTAIRTIAFNSSGTEIIGVNWDGSVYYWGAFDGLELQYTKSSGGRFLTAAVSSAGNILMSGTAVVLFTFEALQANRGSNKRSTWHYQIRITPTGDPVTLYPDGTHYGEGEALEWLEYAEYGLKPDGTPDPIPTLHRATDVPWLRRGPGKEEKGKKGRKRK